MTAPDAEQSTFSCSMDGEAYAQAAEGLAEAALARTRKDPLAQLSVVPSLIIDHLGDTAAEDLLELILRRYERRVHTPNLESSSG